MTYLHLSKKPIIKSKLKPTYSNQFGPNKLLYNPIGLWFSCDDNWIKQQKLSIENNYLYKLDLLQLKIYYISTLSELDEFIKIYYNPERNSIAYTIDWDRVYNEYDGLSICPYLIKNKAIKTIVDYSSFKDKK